MNYALIKTNSSNPDFQLLVKELNAHFAPLNGEKDDFYAQYNQLDAIKHVIIAYNKDDMPIGCGAIRAFSETLMEIKRMYVKPGYRGQGIAASILKTLENWALALGYSETILETLKTEESVVRMYARNGYQIMPNYGQYEGVESSVCMNKKL